MNVTLTRRHPPVPRYPYAYSAVVDPPGLIFTAGACPLDETGQVTAPGDPDQPVEIEAIAIARTAAESRDELAPARPGTS